VINWGVTAQLRAKRGTKREGGPGIALEEKQIGGGHEDINPLQRKRDPKQKKACSVVVRRLGKRRCGTGRGGGKGGGRWKKEN